jgi:YesN/AraC family two-component response regulator
LDLAFAYAAKWQLAFVTKQDFTEKDYAEKVDFYLKQVPETDKTYYDLANIYSIRAQTFRLKEEYTRAYDNLLTAEKLAEQNGDFKQIIKIKSNLSSLLGSLGKPDKAIEEIRKNIKLIDANYNGDPYLDDWKNRNQLNLGVFLIDKYSESSKKGYLDSAASVFNTMLLAKLSDHLQAQVNTKLGIINNELGNYDDATEFYKKSIALYTRLNMQNEIAVIVYNLGYNLYKQKKYAEAKSVFLDILKNKKDTVADKNYLFSHKYLGDIYIHEKNDSAAYYTEKFLTLYANKTEAEKTALAKNYAKIEKRDLDEEITSLRKEMKSRHKLYSLFLIAVSVIITGAAFLAYFFIKKRSAKEKALNDLIKELQENKEAEDTPTEYNAPKITGENEQKIIEGLLKLEKEAFFLKPGFNLHNTAKKIGSNTAYLTAVIKSYKKMSFNEYTNELRINYILKELMVNEKLQNYTIQSLAEVVGYKNGASFSKIFKQRTGVTPFQFIEKLKKETPESLK